MVAIFGMTLEVISRPFNIELLRLCHFAVFLQLLLDMVPLMQILLKTDLCKCRLKKKIEFLCHLMVISRPFKLALLMLPVLVSISVTLILLFSGKTFKCLLYIVLMTSKIISSSFKLE